MTSKVQSSGKCKLEVKMGAFGVKTRNSNLQNKITKLRNQPSHFWGSSIPISIEVRKKCLNDCINNLMNYLVELLKKLVSIKQSNQSVA